MRRLARLYVLASSFLSTAFLCLALFLLMALWIAPDWVQDKARGLGREVGFSWKLERCRKSDEGEPPSLSSPRTAARRTFQGAGSGGEIVWSASSATEKDARIDVAALETRLRLLASSGSSVDEKSSKPSPSEWKEKLDAWERLRSPLFKLLATSLPPGAKETSFGEGSDIRFVAGQAAERLEAIHEERTALKRKMLERMEPRAAARLLVENRDWKDSEALELLRGMSIASANEVLERVSRISPETGGRLLRLVLSLEKEKTAESAQGPRSAPVKG